MKYASRLNKLPDSDQLLDICLEMLIGFNEMPKCLAIRCPMIQYVFVTF